MNSSPLPLLRRCRAVASCSPSVSSSFRRRLISSLCRVNNQNNSILRWSNNSNRNNVIHEPSSLSWPSASHARCSCRYYQTNISVTFTDRTKDDGSNGDGDGDGESVSDAVNPILAKYIKSSLHTQRKGNAVYLTTNADDDSKNLGDLSNDFVVSFLGTGSGGVQSVDRLSSATVLRLGGQAFLFDAGEGLQRQMALSRIKPLDITNIFVTHLHGDHVYGLAGLLLTMQEAASSSLENEGRKTLEERPVVNIYGPSGTYNFIAMMLALSFANLRSITVVVYELVGGKHDAGIRRMQEKRPRRKKGKQQSPKVEDRNILLHRYDEIRSPGMKRRQIRKNGDGYWTLHRPVQHSHFYSRGRNKQFHVHAGEVAHLPGVQTFGYVVEEVTPSRNIDPEKATALGVSPGPKYRELKRGIAVLSDDGTKQVDPEDVLLDHVEPRKFALIGDNCSISREMSHLCQNADVLVHEATIADDEAKAMRRGHATASMAGALANSVKAKALLLNHISPSVSHNEVKDIASKAEETNKSVSQVQVACDFMEVVVPAGGFRFLIPTE